MELTNPAITEGANLFVIIALTLISFAAALSFVNARKEKQKKP